MPSYAEYLRVKELLALQSPLSEGPEHDEMLFIVVHQVYELWFREILHELDRVQAIFAGETVDDRDIAVAAHGLSRINVALRLGVQQLDLLETMTPLDFLDFRDMLYPTSGFQSVQFREIEVRLGLNQNNRLSFDRSPFESKLSDADRERLSRAAERPTLLGLLDAWLARTPFVDWGGKPFLDAYREAVEHMLAADRARVTGDET